MNLYVFVSKQGDVLALYSCNSIEGACVTLAVWNIGGVICPCRPTHTAYELEQQLLQVKAKYFITQEALIEKAEKALTSNTTLKVLLL